MLREYAAEGSDGNADLVVDKEVWEVKVVQASGQDVYQTLYYVDTCKDVKKDTGRLIAPSFSPGCLYTIKLVSELRGVNIKPVTLLDMGFD